MMKAEAAAALKAKEVPKSAPCDTAAKATPRRMRRSKRSTAGVKAMHDDFTVPVYQR